MTPLRGVVRLIGLLICVTAGLTLWNLWATRPDGKLHVTFLDVGQGDAAVITTPRGRIQLIDTGRIDLEGKWDMGERVITPYLKRRGINRIDSLLLTHPDADHIGGATTLLKSFHVSTLFENELDDKKPLFHEIQSIAKIRGVNRVVLREGSTLQLDDAVLEYVLSPFSASATMKDNDRGIALLLDYGKCKLLFMADVESSTEARLVHNSVDLHADLLKVGHHGSRTSTTPEFLSAVSPSYAIISVGAHNRYGHPSLDVVDRLSDANIKVSRTDLNGAVVVDSDGSSITVRGMR